MTTTQASLPIDKPRAPRRPAARRSNFELYAWLFMRLSGVVLLVLVVGHITIMLFVNGGVQRIDFAFVAGRWASPFWQFWDLTMLWLAGLHGGNGLRTVINDYARKDESRFWLKILLYVAVLLIVGLGSFVIFTFDPNIG
jgi:succinate dehydrogenase / fumarate reductase membrane anchor subunit